MAYWSCRTDASPAIGGASTQVPHDAKVIDVTGMTVYPGLIDSETHLGLVEITAERSTVDTAGRERRDHAAHARL